MALPATILTHVASAQARLLAQYQQSPNMLGVLAVLAGRAQVVENAVNQVLTLTGLAASSGQQLDNLGRIIGLARSSVPGGNVDAVYLSWLKAQIAVNASAGTAPNLIAIILAAADAGATAQVVDSGPASARAIVGAVALTQPTALSAALQQARAAGVHLVMEYLASTSALAFTYDGTSAQAYDAGLYGGAL